MPHVLKYAYRALPCLTGPREPSSPTPGLPWTFRPSSWSDRLCGDVIGSQPLLDFFSIGSDSLQILLGLFNPKHCDHSALPLYNQEPDLLMISYLEPFILNVPAVAKDRISGQ